MRSAQHCTWRMQRTQQLLLLIVASHFFPHPILAVLLSGAAGQSDCLEGVWAKAGSRAVLAFEQGKHCPKRPGHFSRHGAQAVGPVSASCPFAQCWLQEFLDSLNEEHAGYPLKVPRDSSYWSMCLLGCKALFSRWDASQSSMHCMIQPNVFSCQSKV